MKKNWNNPELKNLSLRCTSSEGCPYENEVNATPSTLLPEIIWGDGKLGCTHWNNDLKGCEHPNYGIKRICWPCPPVKVCPPTNPS
ncbi:hypothetical protein [Clostridium disporicum]|uniref:Uncharacterized protein n=1 Tax=Clostridium disporicum TaxID=84024 RepID=A0A174GST1_9CLOT|nr:hypothetical protein [Clostridium disporicum]CUO65523.1 Uncharacterised protein [Clostridium disporicum]